MPIYEYECKKGHVTTARGGYDDDIRICSHKRCRWLAHRRSVYADQGVHFKGVGFTRTSVPPGPPTPPTDHGGTTDEHFERMDEFAEKSYKDDIERRPERKELLDQVVKQVERGAIG